MKEPVAGPDGGEKGVDSRVMPVRSLSKWNTPSGCPERAYMIAAGEVA